jgi:hypothetical protein
MRGCVYDFLYPVLTVNNIQEIYSQTAQAGIGKNKGREDKPKLQGISARAHPGTKEANASLPFGGSYWS